MSWFLQEDFDEVETRFRDGLRAALCFHLENEAEADATVSATFRAARKEWDALHGEIAATSLLARVAAETWRRLFAESGAEIVDGTPIGFRRFSLEMQVSRYLEMVRFEAIMAETDGQIARLKAEMAEDGRDRLGEVADLQARQSRLIAGFYNAWLPMDDADDGGTAPALCPTGPVAPSKGPGGAKAWETCDELPRRP